MLLFTMIQTSMRDLIGIIARLKDYFNKPSIVITNSNNLLKGSARSIYRYNLGRVIKNH